MDLGYCLCSVDAALVSHLPNPKVLRFGPPAKKLANQLQALNDANSKVPEIAKALSALGDDPAVHIARRQQLLREARERKRQRERRLRSRDL